MAKLAHVRVEARARVLRHVGAELAVGAAALAAERRALQRGRQRAEQQLQRRSAAQLAERRARRGRMRLGLR